MYPLKRKGKLSLDLFPFFISLFADTDVNAEKIEIFSLGHRFKICDTDLKVERKFKTLFRGFVSSCIGPIF
jgi:hypothetical protein